METHGEGGGDEAGRRGTGELRPLLEAIESSEVVEKRIPLIKQLEGSSHFSADDLGLILQGLLASWIDSTCSGVSHCTLHRLILQVALKCSDLDITDDCLGQFLTLGAKASSWCEKHCKWSVKSVEESQVVQEEEHDRLCLEINSLSFILSTKVLGIAAKCFTALGLELAAGEGGQGAAQEECVLNKADDAFPTLETMAMEVEPAPAHLDVGATPWSLAPVLSPPAQKAARRCTHCASVKTPRWLRGPDGPGTLCNACGLRFYKGRLLQSNSRRCQGHPSKKRHPSKENGAAVLGEVPSENGPAPLPQEASRRCMHCASEKTPRWLCGPNGPGTLCNACGLRFYKGRLLNSYSSRRRGHPSKKRRSSKENSNDVAVAPWSLAPLPQDAWRRCTHCASEKTTRWLQGPDGPGTLCNACGQRFKKGRLNSLGCRGRCSSSMENSAADNDLMAALVEALPCDVGASLDAFFDQKSLEISWEEAGPERTEEEEEEEELEWLLNKDAFPSVETMAPVEEEELEWLWNKDVFPLVETMAPVEVEEETVVSPVLPRRRCTHCATEETPAWRAGPEGPYTLCNPCGIVLVTKGRLLPEYRPANSPGFSRQLHSNIYRRALEMHRQNETSANGSLCRVLEEHRQSEEETSAIGRATAEAGRGEVRQVSTEVPLLPERPAADSPAFSLVARRRVSEHERFAVIRATAKDGRAERSAARLAALDK